MLVSSKLLLDGIRLLMLLWLQSLLTLLCMLTRQQLRNIPWQASLYCTFFPFCCLEEEIHATAALY